MTTANTLRLETYTYAPELNKVHLKNGAVIKAPGCTSVKEWRAKTRQRHHTGIWVEIDKTYDDPKHKWMGQKFRGLVQHRRDALVFRNNVVNWALPTAKITVRTRLVGG